MLSQSRTCPRIKKVKRKNIEIIKLDLNEIDEIIKLRNQFKGRSLDILINNAGIAGTEDSFDTVAPETLLTTFHINTLEPTLIAQALIDSLEIGFSKIIVNISSYYGSIQNYNETDYTAYQISKSALNSATKNMANSLKSKNIIVISIDPGWVKTDMGGLHADITPQQSVSGIRSVIERLALNDSGKFFRYDGSFLPW